MLSQFVIDKEGQTKWIQTERVLQGLNSFFASGIRTLEIKYVLEEAIGKSDILWAGVDVVGVAGTLKLIRTGTELAQANKEWNFATCTELLGSRLLLKGAR